MIAKLLLDVGVDVNAHGYFVDGRYVIEGAAKHGLLDTVQMFLNAVAEGSVSEAQDSNT